MFFSGARWGGVMRKAGCLTSSSSWGIPLIRYSGAQNLKIDAAPKRFASRGTKSMPLPSVLRPEAQKRCRSQVKLIFPRAIPLTRYSGAQNLTKAYDFLMKSHTMSPLLNEFYFPTGHYLEPKILKSMTLSIGMRPGTQKLRPSQAL